MDPQAVGAATQPRSEHVENARPGPRQPASRARRGLLLAAVIGAGLVVSFGVVLASSNIGLVSGGNSAVCVSRGDNSVVDVSRGDTHNLCSQKSFATMPADDAAFEAWLRAQPGVQTVEIRRVGDNALALRLEYLHSGRDNPQWLLSPPWDQLGYQPAPGVSPSILGGPLPRLNG